VTEQDGVMGPPVSVALVNDYQIVVEGLRVLLHEYEEVMVVDLALRETPHRPVDVSLFDTYGVTDGVEERVAELVTDPLAGAVVVFSFSDQQWHIDRLIAIGARGFISKTTTADEIVRGIVAAARGEVVTARATQRRSESDERVRWPGREGGLTGRESELLALLPTGMSNRELAAKLYVSENTVKTQLRGLFRKLGVRNRVQAALIATGGILGERHPLAG
jgi:NarL family two-component system response regulator LiaR